LETDSKNEFQGRCVLIFMFSNKFCNYGKFFKTVVAKPALCSIQEKFTALSEYR